MEGWGGWGRGHCSPAQLMPPFPDVKGRYRVASRYNNIFCSSWYNFSLAQTIEVPVLNILYIYLSKQRACVTVCMGGLKIIIIIIIKRMRYRYGRKFPPLLVPIWNSLFGQSSAGVHKSRPSLERWDWIGHSASHNCVEFQGSGYLFLCFVLFCSFFFSFGAK